MSAIAAAYAKAAASPDLLRKLSEFGADAIPSTPAHFASYIQSETARWRALVRDRGIKAE